MDIDKLNSLKALLLEAKEKEEEKKKRASRLPMPSKKAIENFYQMNGMMTPIKGVMKRPIHRGFYTCPSSEPMTTLVTWDSLPQKVQKLYTKPANGIVLEVRRDHLIADGLLEEETQQHDQLDNAALNRRPLGGNLSSKLTEYTRG
eukprot:scaffold24507_cov122-Cylindrotheca_fusiformis.AAC.1